MAKDAQSQADKASALPPLDVFQVPGINEPANAGAAEVSSEDRPTPRDPQPPPPALESTPSVVIDAPLIEAVETNAEAVQVDVPTVRLRSARPPRSGKRLGREVLLALFGVAFCLVLYGAGNELFGENDVPSASIEAARPHGETTNDGRAAHGEAQAAPAEEVPPLEPLAETPPAATNAAEATAAGASTEAGADAKEAAETAAAKPSASASAAAVRAAVPPRGAAVRAAAPVVEGAPRVPAPKSSNVFDTPLRPPAE